MRSGGASAAANAGVPDRWFQCHGQQRSKNVKDGYVKDKVGDRLAVSRSLEFKAGLLIIFMVVTTLPAIFEASLAVAQSLDMRIYAGAA